MNKFYQMVLAGMFGLGIALANSPAMAQWVHIDSDSTMIGSLPLWELFADQGEGKYCIQETPLEECTYNFCNPSGLSSFTAWGQCLKALRAANPNCIAVMVDLTAICGASYSGRFLVAL